MSRARGRAELPEVAAMLRRMIRAYAARVADEGDPPDLTELLELRRVLDDHTGEAVRGMRERQGRSWAWVAEAAGITRQSAHERWSR